VQPKPERICASGAADRPCSDNTNGLTTHIEAKQAVEQKIALSNPVIGSM